MNKTTTNQTNQTNKSTFSEHEANPRSKHEFISGTVQSFLVVVASQIGDKSFLLTATYSKRFNHLVLMAIAVIVLCVIHGFMTMFGASFCNVLPKLILEYVQVAAFLLMSFMTVYESVVEIRNSIKFRKSGLPSEGDCNEKSADVKVL